MSRLVTGLEQIAYDNAIRAPDKQEKMLEELRARTGVLLASASLAVSLLGNRVHGEPGGPPAAEVRLRPRRGARLRRALRGSGRSRGGPSPLGVDMKQIWTENNKRIAPAKRALHIAAWSLAVEMLALTVLVAGIVS
jgi:hypothetical protein